MLRKGMTSMSDIANRTDPYPKNRDAERVALLYSFGRNYLSLPFSALCVSVVLFVGHQQGIMPFLPLVMQIATAIVAAQLAESFRKRDAGTDPHHWEQRYISTAALTGASWGVGALFWYVPESFPAQACLSLAYMGMTAAEFIARAGSRPAFISHAGFALLPLIIRLTIDGDSYHLVTAALLLCFAGVLAGYSRAFGVMLDESLRLKFDNAGLIGKLSAGKAEAEAARDAARTSDWHKTRFIAAISHELRTPITAMTGMAQMMDQADLPQPFRGYARTVFDAGRSLEVLLDDVIAMVEDGHDTGTTHECDSAIAAHAVLRLFQPLAWRKRLRLSITAGNHLPRAAWGSRGVRQALGKLVENALTFSETGEIEIKVEAILRDGRKFLRFSVIDQGCGVPPEVGANLFTDTPATATPFVRRKGGAGLGLAVVKRIATAAGGECGFNSTLGRGSTFWFTIPAQEADTAGSGAPLDAQAPSDRRFLICLPTDLAEKEIEDVLAPAGNTLVFARNTGDAIARASRERFDAILVHADIADMLAAAPGEKAPILALIPPGGKAAAVTASLAWPSAAWRLYGALGTLLETKPTPSIAAPAALDEATVAALEKTVGTTALIDILNSYLETSAQICTAFQSAIAAGDWENAARLAQDIAGSAGGLGLGALAAAARGFADMARTGKTAPLQNEARTVCAESDRAKAALIDRYPNLGG